MTTKPRTKRAQILARIEQWEETLLLAKSVRDRRDILKELHEAQRELERYDQAVELHGTSDLVLRMRRQSSAALADGSHVAAQRSLMAAHELQEARDLAARREAEARAGNQAPIEAIGDLADQLRSELDQVQLMHLVEILARACGLAYRRGH